MNDKKKDKKIGKKKVIDIIVTIVACVIELCYVIYTFSNFPNRDVLSLDFESQLIKRLFPQVIIILAYYNYIRLTSDEAPSNKINFITKEIAILVGLGLCCLLSSL